MKKFLFALGWLTSWYSTAHAQENVLQESTVFSHPEPKRYLGMVEMGFLYGKGTLGNGSLQATPSVVIFNGYQFNRALAIGATVGINAYEETTLAPVAIGVRGSFEAKRVRPFYSLDLGYSTAFLNNDRDQVSHQGGWMINPAAGILIDAGNQTAFTLGIGYNQQRAKYKYEMWAGQHTTTNNYHFKRLSFRMGFQF